MAYTIAEFIAHAQSGDAIKITNIASNTTPIIKIDDYLVSLDINTLTWTVSNGTKTLVYTDNRELDLGTIFTADQVLNSDGLREAIIEGLIKAESGTIGLSLTTVFV